MDDNADRKSVASADTASTRTRKLTEKGTELYNTKRNKHLQGIDYLWTQLNSLLESTDQQPEDIRSALNLQQQIEQTSANHKRMVLDYKTFLQAERNDLSEEDIKSCDALMALRTQMVDLALSQLYKTTQSKQPDKAPSVVTTQKTTSSTSSSLARRKRAKAEAAKAALEFAQQRAQIIHEKTRMQQEAARQKAQFEEEEARRKADREARIKIEEAEENARLADIENEITLLDAKKEVAVLEAEARVLEQEEDDSRQYDFDLPQLQTEDPIARVKNYVKTHSILIDRPLNTQKPEVDASKVGADKTVKVNQDPVSKPVTALPSATSTPFCVGAVNNMQEMSPVDSVSEDSSHGPSARQLPLRDNQLQSNISATAPPFHLDHATSGPSKTVIPLHDNMSDHSRHSRTCDSDPTTVMTRFLLRKDLLFSRLTKFSDRPESYQVWKTTFKSVTDELAISEPEELDLLVKWLGTESSQYAVSIRESTPDNPGLGVQRLWERLDDKYGCPEMVENSVKTKLANFQKLTTKDYSRLYELTDILSQVEFLKEKPQFHSLLAYFDSSSGVKPIVGKLPHSLQEKWKSHAIKYNSRHGTVHPPFTEFTAFIRESSRALNNPALNYDVDSGPSQKGSATRFTPKYHAKVSSHKTETTVVDTNTGTLERCPIHNTKHQLNECRSFQAKSLEERKKILKDNKICYRCCEHKYSGQKCQKQVSCRVCGSNRHCTGLHINKKNFSAPVGQDGGESCNATPTVNTVKASCTEICNGYSGKSCAKIVPVNVFHKDHPQDTRKVYVMIDDQSNRSLATPEFFHLFDIQTKPEFYTLLTCSGRINTSGRRGIGFVISSLDGSCSLELPTLIECDNIPNNREEIPTPDVALHLSHMQDIVKCIPPMDGSAEILLLIGRDLPEAHHIIDQRTGPAWAPYAQQLKLGWVIIGETCLDRQHAPNSVNVKRTFILPSGRPTQLQPCDNQFHVKEPVTGATLLYQKDFGSSVFDRTEDDNKIGMSVEDKVFLKTMDNEFHRNQDGNWEAPLPFKASRQLLPNNRPQALKRAKILDLSLQRNPQKREHFLAFMSKILDNNHAEVAPPLRENEECWYLPLFGVYHPKKPDQIRGVFDSSAQFEGISLNNVLVTGPDLSNSLLGVLLRFRREMSAVTADIQSMFHCFIVREDHRNYLRFLWHKDNDLNKELIEYRMRVHVFGNSPSPAVATLGLRKAALEAEPEYGRHVKSFVNRDFYVDDGLTSVPFPQEAIKVIKDTQHALQKYGNLRLHKIASNSAEVMEAFPQDDLASNLKDLDLDADNKPLQRSLGLTWDVNKDKFLFELSPDQKPVTRRGVLSMINSIFDPIGFLSPVIIYGKLFLRDIVAETVDWDQPISEDMTKLWENWKSSLKPLEDLTIPRTYVSELSKATLRELHIFSDASEKAIAAVVYLRTKDQLGTFHVGFVLGKAKVAPQTETTIPRKELCAAVLAVEIAQFAIEQLHVPIDTVKFYTDSKVVLSYINNTTRKFYIYVANRVEKIHTHSEPSQWHYVPTNRNPADCATRSIPAADLMKSEWLTGPNQLYSEETQPEEDAHNLVMPNSDKEVRPVVNVSKTFAAPEPPNTWIARFQRFSKWTRLVKAIALLKNVCRLRSKNSTLTQSMDLQTEAELFILKEAQLDMYSDEIDCSRKQANISRHSPLVNLNPFLDELGLLRVGGRIVNSDLPLLERKPLIVPGRHHVATLLVDHHHTAVKHQGRQFTEGAIRSAGYWIVGAKRLISSFIHRCVTCRKLRGKPNHQIMADLPSDRLDPSPPFTNVGVDAFGPWEVVARKTRGGLANAKRWGILFTCLVTRAVHIELVHEMSSSAFINALTRFTSIRGKVKIFRSDRGTNFVGAIDAIQADAINVEDGTVRRHLSQLGTTWIFNAPHSSHMGGVWERMIGVTRRILDGILLENQKKMLTHDVLNTFMPEVCAIINSRPLVPVSSDPESPLILTPAMLLTQKTEYTFTCDESLVSGKDLYKAEWKRVQALSAMFWSRWRREYLPLLQQRRKWQNVQRDVTIGDVVLLTDKTLNRTEWPLGIVTNTFASADGHIRTAEVRTITNGKPAVYTRPVVGMIVLLEDCVL